MRLVFALLVVFVAGCGLDRSAASEPLGARQAAIQGGAEDSADTFAVAVIDASDAVCSATLIAPNLVLTARHCVAGDTGADYVDCATDSFESPEEPSAFRVATATSAPDFARAPYAVAQILVPPVSAFCGNDIALLVLEESIPASAGEPIAPGITPKLTDRATYGGAVSAIGFGMTAPEANDEGTRRRLDDVPIRCVVGDATLGCDPSDYGMTAGELAAGDGLCTGDSGSGAYAETSAGTLVVGVLSRGGEERGKCTDAIYTRVDAFGAFLRSGAREAARAGNYALPSWASLADAGTDDASTPSEPPSPDPPSSDPPRAAPTPKESASVSGCTTASASSDSTASLGAAIAARALLGARRRRRAPARA